MQPIAFYITAHGYGHGTRSCDVLRALHRIQPEQPVIVTTDLPRDFLDSRLTGCSNLTFRAGAFDVGLIQKDSIRSDLPHTLQELENLYSREKLLIAQEEDFLQKAGVSLTVADIPAIPLAAAQRSGLRNIAIGNFSWDWIYEAYIPQDPRWTFFAEKFKEVYRQTGLLLRLPFAPPMESFPEQKNIPLLAEPGAPCRERIAAAGSAGGTRAPDPGKTWVLLSFTSLELDGQALDRIGRLSSRYEFFCVEPLRFENSRIHSVSRSTASFAAILASCDIVISKPGFGLVSECIVNGKPLIYADRDHFAEYPYLVDGIGKYLRNVYLPSAKLYAGDLEEALEKIKTAPDPAERMARGGAEIIARELLKQAVA